MKKVILMLMILGMIVLSGCGGTKYVCPDGSTVSDTSFCPKQNQQKTACNSPYMQIGSQCCLDKNNNGICDNDEKPEPKIRIEHPWDPVVSDSETEMKALGGNKFRVLKTPTIILDNFRVYNDGNADAVIISTVFNCNNEFEQSALLFPSGVYNEYKGISFSSIGFICNCHEDKCELEDGEIMVGQAFGCEKGKKLKKIYAQSAAQFAVVFSISDKTQLPATLVCTLEIHWLGGDNEITQTYHVLS